jgi:RHS repeat-associated protein
MNLQLSNPGQYFDAESGLHQNYFRDYDPKMGRYIEPDPIGIQKGNNHLYNYAVNNPLRFYDSKGLATYTGTVNIQGAGYFGFGGAFMYGMIRTKCENGKYKEGYLTAEFFGGLVGFPIKSSAVLSIHQEDNLPGIGSLTSMEGSAVIVSFSGAVGIGGYVGALGLGNTKSVGLGSVDVGLQYGIDASGMLMVGKSQVSGIKEKSCCE